MKFYFLILLTIIISCNKTLKKEPLKEIKQEHTNVISNNKIVPLLEVEIFTESYQDMIDEQLHPNTLSKKTLKEIKDFKPFVQDIVFLISTYPNDLEITEQFFKHKEFCFYTALGYDYFSLYQNVLVLTEKEKKYLWRLYLFSKENYSNKVRLYEWDNPNLKK